MKKRKLLLEEQNKGSGSESAISAWFDAFREKANYLEKVNQVPGLKCDGAACSNGLDIRNPDRLEKFAFHLYRTFFDME